MVCAVNGMAFDQSLGSDRKARATDRPHFPTRHPATRAVLLRAAARIAAADSLAAVSMGQSGRSTPLHRPRARSEATPLTRHCGARVRMHASASTDTSHAVSVLLCPLPARVSHASCTRVSSLRMPLDSSLFSSAPAARVVLPPPLRPELGVQSHGRWRNLCGGAPRSVRKSTLEF